MYALIEGGSEVIDVLFFENKDDEYAFARAGFDKKYGTSSSFVGTWDGLFVWSKPDGRRIAFDFTPGDRLSEVVSDRQKKQIGVAGWMLLEKAYELAFVLPKKRGMRQVEER